MAGETPDRSERRKSAGKPVAGEGDPRLAVFREGADGAPGTAGAPGTPGTPAPDEASAGVDQPTAVFSTEGLAAKGRAPERVEAKGKTDDARLRAAVAAWVATSDSDSDSDSDSGSGSGSDAAPDSGAAPDAAVASANSAPEEPAARPDPAGSPDAEPDADPVADPEAPVADDARAGESTGESGVGDTSASTEAADGSADDSDEPGAPDGAARAESVATKPTTPDAPASASAAGAPAGGDEPSDAEAVSADGGDDAPGTGTGTGIDEGTGAGAGAGDQATAVFKAVSVGGGDQPTAMLKAVRPSEAEAEAEAEAERTSKFVALKQLDGAPGTAKSSTPSSSSAPSASAPPEAPGEPDQTTQQPLPPRPPLDLLAELTNRPPKPETPVRNAVRRVKIWTPLLVLAAVVFAVVQSARPLPAPGIELTAAETFTFDGDKPSMPWPTEGQAVVEVDGIGSLGTYGEQKAIPIGSVAKAMTAYAILKDHKPDETLTVDKQAEDDYVNGLKENESVVKVKEGQEITVKEAVQALMLPSANNVARLLARWDGKGDADVFVDKMNKAAADLGMDNTTYTDPSGLEHSTVSSAADQVKLGKAAMDIPVFKQIVRQPGYQSTTSDREEKNYNKLVPLYDVVGIKTGSTTKAGGNLLFAAEKQIGGSRQLIIGAVFGQHGVPILDTAVDKSLELIQRTQQLLEAKTVVKKGDVVGVVDDGLGGRTPVVATKDVTAVGWPGLTVKLELTDGGKTPPHAAKAGTKVGVLNVGDGDGGAVRVPVALQSDVTEPGFTTKLARLG
ncbi:D-alanyl-D-alanine carboxypeptidase [Streptomyces apocyni]|uniref:D-alanyl-D-alanine carboxypeptidase n=1 Tax=Streptomyces apocyni TaxID=2654677 RepID=UPI0012EA0004|nr:D-alanyl-D-alanine carboxypeptidase [Streptomyces apocyni]